MDAAQTEKQYVYVPPEHRTSRSPSALPRGRERWLDKKTILSGLLGVSLAVATLGAHHFLTPINSLPQHTNITTDESISRQQESSNPKLQKQISQLLFDGFSRERLEKTKKAMEEEAKIFIPNPTHEQARLLATKPWENLANKVVEKSELNIAPEEQKARAQLLTAMIYVESGGNPLARSSTGASGLMQVEKDSTDRAAKALKKSSYNPFDPEDNLTIADKILQRNLYLFNGNLELALAAYNLGDNTIAGALKTFYISVKKMNMGQVQEDFNNMGRHGDADPASRVYLQEHPVTFEDLFIDPETSPAVTGYLSSVWGVNKNELNFNNRVYLAAESLFPEEINPVFTQKTRA